MKKYIIIVIMIFSGFQLVAQENTKKINSDSTKVTKENWFKRNNFMVRQTFDGSINENKPATLIFFKDNESGNDFFTIDIAVKIAEIANLYEEKLIIYPVIEWHKSSNVNDEKDNLSAAINTESLFGDGNFQPYLINNVKLNRNFLTNVFEFDFSSKITLIGAKKRYLPGYQTRSKNLDYTFRYYPYVGYEYHIIPELISQNETEKFSIAFLSLYAELWIDKTHTYQIITEGIYRNTMNTVQGIRKDLPLIDLSFNWYPLSQENFSIGINHKNGYDPSSRYQKVQITSISANIKL